MTEETVTITKEEYKELLRDQSMLFNLEFAGVASWEGYGEATKGFRRDNEEDDEG